MRDAPRREAPLGVACATDGASARTLRHGCRRTTGIVESRKVTGSILVAPATTSDVSATRDTAISAQVASIIAAAAAAATAAANAFLRRTYKYGADNGIDAKIQLPASPVVVRVRRDAGEFSVAELQQKRWQRWLGPQRRR